MHEVGWGRESALRAGNYNFGRGKISENHKLLSELFAQHRILSAIKRVEFFKDRMLYIVLIDSWCNVIFVNVPVPVEEKSDDKRDSFFVEL